MPEITLALPDSITENEPRIALAARLDETGRFSCEQAAELGGYSERTFTELLGKERIAVIDYPAEELPDDLRYA